jgi:hypothetical protein
VGGFMGVLASFGGFGRLHTLMHRLKKRQVIKHLGFCLRRGMQVWVRFGRQVEFQRMQRYAEAGEMEAWYAALLQG